MYYVAFRILLNTADAEDAVTAAILRLPVNDMIVLKLRYAQGYSNAEIAELLRNQRLKKPFRRLPGRPTIQRKKGSVWKT